MPISSLKRFETEFHKWILAHNRVHGFTTDPDTLLAALRTKIPDQSLSQIGSAYLNGWLQTEASPSRGYFVREADRPGLGGGQFTIMHRGDGKVAPCWELFVQLADYSMLRTIAERHGQEVRIEDSLMDLTVRAGNKLILYVEQKTTSALADGLLQPLMEYGRRGFQLDDADKGNDPLRKAKYLVRGDAQPIYFGLSSVDYKRLFRVEYMEGNRFELHEENQPFGHVLANHRALDNTAPPPRSPIDSLAIEMERQCPNCWVSVGSGQTAYNFYVPGQAGDAIVIGVFDNGTLWTDVKRLGVEISGRLVTALSGLGIDLPGEKEWAYWRRGRTKVNLADLDPVEIANALREAFTGSRPGSDGSENIG